MRAEPVYNGPRSTRHPASADPRAIPVAGVVPGYGTPATPAATGAAVAAVSAPAGGGQGVDYRAAQEIKKIVLERLHEEGKHRTPLSPQGTEQRGRHLINEQVAIWSDAQGLSSGGTLGQAVEQDLAALAFDMCFRAGRLQRYLDDERVEDIWLEGFERVFLKYSGRHEPARAGRVADSEEELQDLVRDLIRASGQNGRTFSTHSPDVELRLPDGSRLQALGPEITGGRTHVTIRRHRHLDIDLARLVALGTLSLEAADLLAAAVHGRLNVMVAGEQASGKTTLLRALIKEIPRSQRFGTVETTFEGLADPAFHEHVVPMEARFSNGERIGPVGAAAGEITLMDLMLRAKRMSLTRTIVGEVRGPEITAMMQAMTSDRPGNMCTIHASEPAAVFDRVAELYLLAQANFTPELAYRQIANGLHLIAFLSVDDSTDVPRRYLSHLWEITGIGHDGRPMYNEVFGPADDLDGPAVPKGALSERRRRRLEQAGMTSPLLSAPALAYAQGRPL
ncbi:CpaF family protein [Streptomyces longispororuber]|uniref:CpaF family protein n=1 Tax=Streptomyces longispororuber TaxID=68230 RepID=UPI00210D718F|nr:CpaF/VirB11 family protein [Streptomyces longispororuber]MCQ4214255.1 CpaF/VirB11 family protein [Streptomyces longispororuber]